MAEVCAGAGSVQRQLTERPGNGADFPAVGDKLHAHYTVSLCDAATTHVDSSRGEVSTTTPSGITVLKKNQASRSTREHMVPSVVAVPAVLLAVLLGVLLAALRGSTYTVLKKNHASCSTSERMVPSVVSTWCLVPGSTRSAAH